MMPAHSSHCRLEIDRPEHWHTTWLVSRAFFCLLVWGCYKGMVTLSVAVILRFFVASHRHWALTKNVVLKVEATPLSLSTRHPKVLARAGAADVGNAMLGAWGGKMGAGRTAARVVGIDVDRYSKERRTAVPGNPVGVSHYVETEPTAKEALGQLIPTAAGVKHYFRSLFPFLSWIFHYNLTWLSGDLIAGITVGFVVVPQGMAYALLAQLPPEFGLYTSFVGFLLYWAFATSKDITIGTVAVMSTIVGNVVIRVQSTQPDIPAEQIARCLALLSGVVLLFLGLIRAGFIVEFISLTAIASFMTGAAVSIAAGQVPTMMGISGVSSRDPTYLVIINTLKGLPRTKLDAAMGLSALVMLYSIRSFCNFMAKRQPRRQKMWFFIATLRMAFVILLYILISFLVNRNVTKASDAKFRILGTVPSGFQHVGAPVMTSKVLNAVAPDLPVTIIVLIIEHIAISKSFGRINNYIIDPSQELVAIGFSNVFGPFLGGYPATGSFSRTAIKAKAGVRTPLAGIFTAAIVLLALYVLTSVFFYIPSASLAALIIHAVGDLITPPNTVYQFWMTSPIEVVVFFAGVILTIFTNIENGIYLNMAASAALLLFRIARSPGRFMGHTRIYTTTSASGASASELEASGTGRDAYFDEEKRDNANPDLPIRQVHPGIFVYRFPDGFNYTNSAAHLDFITMYVYKKTRRTVLDNNAKIGDRPWNDPGPRRGQVVTDDMANRPILRAMVLDFSSINYADVTSVQALIDLRNQFAKHAAPSPVEWHFAGVTNRWTKRALVAAGFGFADTAAEADPSALSPPREKDYESDSGSRAPGSPNTPWAPLFSVSVVDGSGNVEQRHEDGSRVEVDAEKGTGAAADGNGSAAGSSSGGGKLVPVYGLNRPFFHVDVAEAVQSALSSIESNT
ncbi:hypothetical protein PspLS_06769 [Pyricularia sp. CBS 133598]|nr:hypothetical protein PspLS_06769 [Pyricularia sp. CBS 133598]